MQVFSDSPTVDQIDPRSTTEAIELRMRALQDQIDALEEDLARSERLATLGAMSGAVAHEFNNILTPLMSYASLALVNLDDERLVRKALQKTVENVERASQIAASLLGSLQEQPAASSSNLRVAAERAFDALVRSPEADGIEVLLDIPNEIDAAINPADLHQILLNLVLNACDAMRPGPGTLAITARVNDEEGQSRRFGCHANEFLSSEPRGCVAVRVVDTGTGIDPSLIEHIFDPLVTTKQWGTALKQQSGGSGLGLTICKKLVERAGGRITVRSEPGVGTCFTIRLPRPCAADSDHQSGPIAA